MKTTYTLKDIWNYLTHFRYTPSFRRGNKYAFYNSRNNLDLLIPFNQQSFTKKNIIELFNADNATDYPSEIEWCRFQLFTFKSNTYETI